jgi:DNA-binding NarL/FixJ family response regulator
VLQRGAGGIELNDAMGAESTQVALRLPLEARHACLGRASFSSTTTNSSVRGLMPKSTAAVEMIVKRQPDVVLLNVHNPDGGGLRAVREVRATGASVRFLVPSVSDAAENAIW